MRRLMTLVLPVLAVLTACGPTQEADFDPEDPAAIAEIDALVQQTLVGVREVDADRVLAMAEGGAFSFITGDLQFHGLEEIREDFEDTYASLESQDQTVLDKQIRLLSPTVAVLTATSEGTYTDKAGWTSEPVGMGHTIIFVHENGKWRARHVHQSIAY